MRKPVLFSCLPSFNATAQTAQVLINHKDFFALYAYAGDATGVQSSACKGDAYVLCFVPSERSSFYELSLFREKILSFDPKAVFFILELEDSISPTPDGSERAVSEKRAKKLAEEFNCLYLKHTTPIHPEVIGRILSKVVIRIEEQKPNKLTFTLRRFMSIFDDKGTKAASKSSSTTSTTTNSTAQPVSPRTETPATTTITTNTTTTTSPRDMETKRENQSNNTLEELERTRQSLFNAKKDLQALTEVCRVMRQQMRSLTRRNKEMSTILDLYDLEYSNALTPLRNSTKIVIKELRTEEEIARLAFDKWRETVQTRKSEREIKRLLEEDKQIVDNELGSKEYTCPVCYSDYGIEDMYVIDECYHRFCFGCIGHYIKEQINQGNCKQIKCPDPTCSVNLHPQEIRHCVDGEMYAKYEKFALKSALDAMPNLVYCPKLGCNNAMIGDEDTEENPMIRCSNPECQFTFCCNCKEEWHADVTCAQWQQWKKENSENDQRTEDWLKLNAKACPQCKSAIEKNGGCNHMTCKKCQYEFCWLCMKKYTTDHFGNFAWSCKQFT
eukprot:TRINITY_DN5678_c0_g1_i1.p1 TRINITY_DN5678_c0_g1~~TRINITY_DN5678_c0_g1_i1.p1  ORF type:complete len:591 (+),score=97.65 TRINITY_DN5678_c0_g1_i1:108-1775(+)